MTVFNKNLEVIEIFNKICKKINKNLNFSLHRGLLNKKLLGLFRPVRPAGMDFQAPPGPACWRPGPLPSLIRIQRITSFARAAQPNNICISMAAFCIQYSVHLCTSTCILVFSRTGQCSFPLISFH